MSDIYAKNLEELKKVSHFLSQRLMAFEPTEKFEIFLGDDPANINMVNKESFAPLYASGPIDETIALHEKFQPKKLYPFLYFYGLGNGIIYKLLLANEQHKRIAVIEPELDVIYAVLHLIDLTEEIKSERLRLYYTEDFDFTVAASLFSHKDAKIFSKIYSLELLLPYYESYHDDIIRVNQDFTRAIEHNVYSAGNDTIDSLMGLEHFIQNLPTMVKNSKTVDFIKSIKNTDTAVIVSTGPSLNKQLPLLKKIQDYVTIFSIDATLPILQKWGIKPDVSGSIERIELTAKFYEELDDDFQKDIAFAVTAIAHDRLVNAIHSEKLNLSMRPFGYMKYFDMDDWGYLGLGMSVANMILELVYHAGFKKCIIIGQDLAYSDDGTSHAKGATLGEHQIKNKDREKEIWLPAYGGSGLVKSRQVWKMFLNFYERDIELIKEFVEVINSTEAGARIHGTIERPFVEVCEEILKAPQQKSVISINKPTKKETKRYLRRAKEKISSMLHYSQEIKEEIEELFLDLTKTIEKIEIFHKANDHDKIDFDKIDDILDRIAKVKGYFTDEIFQQLFIDILQSNIMHQELELAKIQVRVVTNEEEEKAKKISWLYAHKIWLFTLAGGIDAIMTVVERSKKAVLTA